MPALPVAIPTVKVTFTVADCPTERLREEGEVEQELTIDGLTQEMEKVAGPIPPSLVTVKLADALPPGATVLLTPQGEMLAMTLEQGSTIIDAAAESMVAGPIGAACAGVPNSKSRLAAKTQMVDMTLAVLDELSGRCSVARIRVAPV